MSPRNDDDVPVWTRRRPTGFDVMPEGTSLPFLFFLGGVCFSFIIKSLEFFFCFKDNKKREEEDTF
mgnify:CR=1